jgi:prolyl-tRNA editing enzyme YbaK/EbsC (Cys-tRNA(Pro) deacylase)
MRVGELDFIPIAAGTDLVAEPVRAAVQRQGVQGLWVSPIDPDLADTAGFCAHYGIDLEMSANCVIVEAKRAERISHAACLVLATTRADVNGVVRKRLDARKASFASMATAIALSGMEYGGITPVGLPQGWPVLIDERIVEQGRVIIGSGVRASKILADAAFLTALPGAEVLPLVKPA